MSGPLAGVRVLDLSQLAPGPYCSLLLAELGAEVTVVRGGHGSAPIASLARGKRVVTLDLRDPLGRSALARLARDADVVIEGFRPGVAARLGAGYDELARVNPRLVYCSLTGYGQRGRRSGEAGHDINYLAVSGVLGALGPPDGDPVPPLNLVADFGAGGTAAAFAIVAALFARERTGRGRYLDVSMVDGCRRMMAFHRPAWGTPAMPARGVGCSAAGRRRTGRIAARTGGTSRSARSSGARSRRCGGRSGSRTPRRIRTIRRRGRRRRGGSKRRSWRKSVMNGRGGSTAWTRA